MKPKKNESKQSFLKRCTSARMESEDMDEQQAFAACALDWGNARGARQRMTLTAPVTLTGGHGGGQIAEGGAGGGGGSGTGDRRGFLIHAYTGKPFTTWYGSKIYFELDGMSSKERIPILREHRRDRVVGHGAGWKDASGFYVQGDFSKASRDGREVLALADEDYPWQASIGVWPEKIKVLESDKETARVNGAEITGPAEVWLESSVGEVSFVSLGMDDNTAAIALSNDPDGIVPVEIVGGNLQPITDKEVPMDPITLKLLEKENPELLLEIRDAAFAEGRAAGVAQERARVTEIMAAEADLTETRKAIDDGIEAAAAYKGFYQAERARRAQGLEDLAAAAPAPVGVETPADPAPAESVDRKLSKMAREYAAEHGVTLSEAHARVSEARPDLLAAWRPGEVPS